MSKVILQFDDKVFPPILTLSIFGAPHRRQSKNDLDIFREVLFDAWLHRKDGDLDATPIDYPIDLSVIFIDPCSPDLDNCITALYRSMDGKTWKKPSIMTDDGLIQKVTMMKFYPSGPGKADNRIP